MKLWTMTLAGSLIANTTVHRLGDITVAQASQIPQVFLNPEIWSNGLITLLAVFLLWQSWTREQSVRKESADRETRMAGRIDTLEARHAEELKRVVVAVQTLEHCQDTLMHLKEIVQANCTACDARRNELSAKIESLNKSIG